MSTLEEDYSALWNSVRTDAPVPHADDLFRGTPGFSVAERLAVYRRSYWAREVEALRTLFPSVEQALGPELFVRTASRFVGASPSTDPTLEGSGGQFPAWLRATSVEVAELAVLDWARWTVTIAEDRTVLTRASVDPARLLDLSLRRAPHVQVVALESGPVAIWRERFSVFQRPLRSGEHRALEASATGLSFPEWCALISEDCAGAEPDVAAIHGHFEAWVSRGWLLAQTEAS